MKRKVSLETKLTKEKIDLKTESSLQEEKHHSEIKKSKSINELDFPIKQSSEISTKTSYKKIDFSGHKGIISYLRKQNPLYVRLNASSNLIYLEYLFEHDCSFWCSKNQPNSWIRIDFSPVKICVSSYLLRSDLSYFPQGWKFEGSNDNSNWESIDQQLNQRCLSSSIHEHIFQCQSKDFFSLFQFTQIQINTDYHNNFFALNFIEFSGKIMEK
jgi:hypothetical protein